MTKQVANGALLVAGLVVAAGVWAPAAHGRPTCQGSEQVICQTNGSVSIKTRPGTKAPPANQAVYPWMGAGVPGAE